jgi:Protein of unknown function (DUF2735)
MTTTLERETAKIYEFPVSPRPSTNRRPETAETAARRASKRVSQSAFGSWYHEAAVREDDVARER